MDSGFCFLKGFGLLQKMSSLKIPDLNLFRGKRGNRENIVTRIQENGMRVMQRVRGKAYIDEMQAQLYLDNYKSNLKHFVSPTKFKDQAQKYLKSSKGSDQMYLKALQFPSSKRYCSNCFDHYLKTNRQCICQSQQRVPQMYRQKETVNMYRDRGRKQEAIKREQNDVISSRKEEIDLERQDISHDFNLTDSEEVPHQLENERHEARSIISTLNRRILPDSSYFYQNLRKRQDELDHLHMNIEDSRTIVFDFQGLNEARKQYVKKSHQILDHLDNIIRSHSP